MKIAVIDCHGRGSRGRRLATLDAIGIGPRLVIGILESLGCEPELYMCEELIKGNVRSSDYDLLMISAMSSDVPSVIRAIRNWRGSPVVVGGPIFVEYEKLIKNGVDYVIWGEGELSIPKFINYLRYGGDVEEVPNLIHRGKKGIVRNPGPPYAKHPPLWDFNPSVKAVIRYPLWRAARVYVEVVRGCSNFYRPLIPLADGRKCILCDICRKGPLDRRHECPINIPPGCGYCSVPALFGPARSRPTSKIVNEVKELLRIGVTRIVLSAPDFLDYGRDWLVSPKPLTDPRNPPPNLKAIEELLKSLTSLREVVEGSAYIMIENIKPNLVNEEVVEILSKYLKDTPVNIGLESGDPWHHKALGRPSSVEEVIKAVKLLVNAGLRSYIYLIHGLPGESKETIRNNIKVAKELANMGIEKIILYRFTPVKNTAVEGYPKPPPAVKAPTAKK
ncbi:MAG: B12-binding domain-containing radical SAM protein, partial [Thermoprotei archaeon]